MVVNNNNKKTHTESQKEHAAVIAKGILATKITAYVGECISSDYYLTELENISSKIA